MRLLISTSLVTLTFLGFCQNAFAYKVGNADLTLRPSVRGAYDDNITYLKDDAKSDFVTHLGMSLDFGFENPTNSGKLSGGVFHHIFADNGHFDNTSEIFSAEYDQEITKRDRITLRDAFSHAEEPRDFEDAFGRSQGRYSHYRNTLDFGYSREILEEFALQLSYTNQYYTSSLEGSLDSWLNRGAADIVYSFNSATTVVGGYEYRNRSFDGGIDSNTHSLTAGVQQHFTKKLYLDARGGVDFISSFSGRDYTRPVIQASLNNEWNDTTRASIAFQKRYDTTSFRQDLFDQWRVSANVSRDFTARLRGSARAFYGEGEYISTDRTDKLSGVSLSLQYDLWKNIKADLAYSYSEVNSTFDTQDYTKNLVSFGLLTEF